MKFLQEMSKHEEVTMMGPKNFAVVVTPNILRNPAGDDPVSMLRNNGFEMAFVRLLIENADRIAKQMQQNIVCSDG